MLTEEFGRRLKYWREKRGMNQKEFAAKLGVTASIVSRYEHGSSFPTFFILEDILTALNVSIADFFSCKVVEVPPFGWVVCRHCGVKIARRSSNHKYCSACCREISRQKMRERYQRKLEEGNYGNEQSARIS